MGVSRTSAEEGLSGAIWANAGRALKTRTDPKSARTLREYPFTGPGSSVGASRPDLAQYRAWDQVGDIRSRGKHGAHLGRRDLRQQPFRLARYGESGALQRNDAREL